MPRILIIDDEKSVRQALREILDYEKFDVEDAPDGPSGLKLFSEMSFDLVLCDIKMPKMDGMEVLEKIQKIQNDVPVVMISGHGNIETAVDAIKKGAYDYISKPLDLNRLLVTVRNAMDKTSLVQETKILKKKIAGTKEMIGKSSSMNAIREMIEKVAPTDARVLIVGGNGTGKELVARSIHEKSQRASAPMVEVNCAAIPSELIESELFGHEKGSFTSAIKQRLGKFELAHNGTLFLDEIGDMSLSAQAKVLRALQEGKISRVGGEKEISVNVRVIAATNKDLKNEIANHTFREDLFHRLSVIVIDVPSLNDRKDDIPLIAQHFIQEISTEQGIAKKELSDEAIKELQKINWTGNIRELRNVIERLLILCDKKISAKDISTYVRKD